jgi:hypothetical protein
MTEMDLIDLWKDEFDLSWDRCDPYKMSDFPVPPMFPPMYDGEKPPKPLPSGNMNQPPRPPKAPPDAYEGSEWDSEKPKAKKAMGFKVVPRGYGKIVVRADTLVSEAWLKITPEAKDNANRPPGVEEKYRRESILAE